MSIVKLNNRGVRSATAFGSITGLGSFKFIKKQTASSSSTVSFVHGSASVVFDSTYKEYLFTFKNIHPSAESYFGFNMTIDSGSNYNVQKTTSTFRSYHREDGGESGVSYVSGEDLDNGTGLARLTENPQMGTNNDENLSGYLHFFNPSDTTFTKHFHGTMVSQNDDGQPGYIINFFTGGYGNTTSAVNGIQFAMGSGNIDAGDICLYGLE